MRVAPHTPDFRKLRPGLGRGRQVLLEGARHKNMSGKDLARAATKASQLHRREMQIVQEEVEAPSPLGGEPVALGGGPPDKKSEPRRGRSPHCFIRLRRCPKMAVRAKSAPRPMNLMGTHAYGWTNGDGE